MNGALFLRLRFACKLTFAIVLALFLGFHLQLQTPRWSVLTAAIVAAGPAFAAGGEPFAGAIRYRGWLRIIGTFLGTVAGLLIMVLFVRAPLVMLLLCCAWAGVCTWLSSLVRVENSYALGLSGYTALILVVTSYTDPMLAPQFAVERCSEIVLGIMCAILADILFSPRSIKSDIDRQVSTLMVEQFQLLQLCIRGESREVVDKAWNALVRDTNTLNGMRSNLALESSRWARCNRRLRAMNTLSLTMITQACETFFITNQDPARIKSEIQELVLMPVETLQDVHKRMKHLRQLIAVTNSADIPLTISSWVGAATRYLLLAKGVHTNGSINSVEEGVLEEEIIIKSSSAEGHHAMINGLRTWAATSIGALFWLWTGWTSGSGFMVMIAVVTSLAMRTPNPRMTSIDFLMGTAVALPLGALYYMLIIPSTQQSMLLLCISLGVLAFFIGIEVQKRRLGSLGTLASTINVLMLSNPMNFSVTYFIDNALGQIIGCFVAMIVLFLIRDRSKARTGRTLLNRFVYSAVSALTTNQARRNENHLPALYQQLFQLLNMFPNDIAKYRLALTLIIAHQRLRNAPIPENQDLSDFHKQIRATANRIITTRSDNRRRVYFDRLLEELEIYQQKLVQYEAPYTVTIPVKRLAMMLDKYQRALVD
ncbi:p-hydroxybenzoic acid efflux pump subunit AaeB [Enterobacillus tribolii]|uniref:p-hydroxybenzoic acid efflux pump subunit AaeB n=1 Tax=Enterobacillus tribolii TaxID=1487935 RepID=A0A370QGG6_9GAMM|nr:p-hydroxybenzoic acid efflux pump subunit AaeB [Enterobacillus tribolii]MBW7981775.1 p-hydroxybenzoic acid efflux pump subunit AaeB [Enterobacillus tribolii]RDK87457.1 p-hydroxybenzoic acid efflux pump subunit AaeB [Enterobacillus tribolii]